MSGRISLGSHLAQDSCLLVDFFFMFIFERERERERERESAGEGQKEKETEDPKQAPCCQHPEPETGLELMNHEIMT